LRLEFRFPSVTTAAVTATRVSENEKFTGAGIASRTFLAPPVGDGVSGEGGRWETPTTKAPRFSVRS
jgi:hypothetical protein